MPSYRVKFDYRRPQDDRSNSIVLPMQAMSRALALMQAMEQYPELCRHLVALHVQPVGEEDTHV